MKAKRTKNFNNYKMDNRVYQLRRKVIDMIYEVKNEIKSLPRIDVRIGEHKCNRTLAVARLNDNIVWVTEDAINQGEDRLRNTVYHEIVHAVTGFGHDESCPLMESKANHVLNKQECMQALKKYIQ
jgi:hypothetical protein